LKFKEYKKMNAKITAAFVAGLAAVMACVYAMPTQQAAELPPPRVVVAECHNLQALDAAFGAHFDTAKYALERLKAHCDAGNEAAVLMQVWEQDPTAGVVHE
jgi:lipoprotein